MKDIKVVEYKLSANVHEEVATTRVSTKFIAPEMKGLELYHYAQVYARWFYRTDDVSLITVEKQYTVAVLEGDEII